MTAKLCGHLMDYFNDALSPFEKKNFEKHLEECQDCRDELNELQLLTEDLPYISEPVNPPQGMKDRILSNVLDGDGKTNDDVKQTSTPVSIDEPRESSEPTTQIKTKNRNTWVSWGLAACLAVSLLTNGYLMLSKDGNEQADDSNALNPATLIADATLKPTKDNKMTAKASMIQRNKETYLVIHASNLKPLTGNEVYEAWLIKDGKPYPAGTFKPDASGDGVVNFQVSKNISDWDAVAISLEPNPNSEAPQGPVLLNSSL